MTAPDPTQPLPRAQETFAALLSRGVDAPTAYRESGVGSELGCTVPAAERIVAGRVAWLRENGGAAPKRAKRLMAADITSEFILDRLEEDRALALSTGQANAAARCTELMGKAVGHFVERSVAVTATVDVPDLELAQRIAYLLIAGGSSAPATAIEASPLPSSPDRATT